MDPNSIIKLLRQQRRQINDSFNPNANINNNIDFNNNNNNLTKHQYQKEIMNNNSTNNAFLMPASYVSSNTSSSSNNNRLVSYYDGQPPPPQTATTTGPSIKMVQQIAAETKSLNQISSQNYNRIEYYSANNTNNNTNLNLINSAKNNDSHHLMMNNKLQKRNEQQQQQQPHPTPLPSFSSSAHNSNNNSSQINYYNHSQIVGLNDSMTTRSTSVKSAASDSGIGSTSPLSDCSDLQYGTVANSYQNNNIKRQYLYEKNKYVPATVLVKAADDLVKHNYNTNETALISNHNQIRKRKSNDNEIYSSSSLSQQANLYHHHHHPAMSNNNYVNYQKYMPLMNPRQQTINYQINNNRYNNVLQTNQPKNVNECPTPTNTTSNMYKPINYNSYNLQANTIMPSSSSLASPNKHSNIQATFVTSDNSKKFLRCDCNDCDNKNALQYLTKQSALSNNNNNNSSSSSTQQEIKPYKIACNCSDPNCTYNYEANYVSSTSMNHHNQSVFQKVNDSYYSSSIQQQQRPSLPPPPPPPPPQSLIAQQQPNNNHRHHQVCNCSECFKTKQLVAYNNSLYQTKQKLNLVSEPVMLSSSTTTSSSLSLPILTNVSSKSLLNQPTPSSSNPHKHVINHQHQSSKTFKTYRVSQEQAVQFLEDEYNELTKNGVQITKLRNVFYDNYFNENNPDINENNNSNNKNNETQINNANINLIKQAKSQTNNTNNNYISATSPNSNKLRNRNSADSISSNSSFLSSSSSTSSTPSPSNKKSPSLIVSPLINEKNTSCSSIISNNSTSIATQPTSIVCLSVNNNSSDDENDFELGEVIKIDKLKNTANFEILENSNADICLEHDIPVQLSKKILPIVNARIHDWLEKCIEFTNSIQQKYTQLNSNEIFELLIKAWPKLLLVYMIENSFDFCVTKMMLNTSNNNSGKSEKDLNSTIINNSKLPKERDAIQLISLINKGYSFNLSPVEFDLLREIILFKEGEENELFYFKFVNAQKILQETVETTQGNQHFLKLSSFLPSIFNINTNVIQSLFCRNLSVNEFFAKISSL